MLKDAVVLLSMTLRAYSYNTQPLLDFLETTRERYQDSLMKVADLQVSHLAYHVTDSRADCADIGGR